MAVSPVNFNISSIDKINPISLNNRQVGNVSDISETTSFGDFLSNALNKVNSLQLDSAAAEEKLAAGEIQDIHSVMIASEKADLALQFTLTIRNKIMDAYSEIMRMQL